MKGELFCSHLLNSVLVILLCVAWNLCYSRSVTLKGLNIYANTYFTLCILLDCHYLYKSGFTLT